MNPQLYAKIKEPCAEDELTTARTKATDCAVKKRTADASQPYACVRVSALGSTCTGMALRNTRASVICCRPFAHSARKTL